MSVELKADIGKYIFDVVQGIWPENAIFQMGVDPKRSAHLSRCRQHAGATDQLTAAGACAVQCRSRRLGFPGRMA